VRSANPDPVPEPAASRLVGKVMRGSAVTVAGFAGAQVIRLAANMALARILFPEAFGLMALVTVVLVGLIMFSDVGIMQSIQSSKRGDEPDFLDTAWTIQVIRGAVLTLCAAALAWPMAWFYGEEMLKHLIPVAALSLMITAWEPTRVDTASRHMALGRLTLLQLAAQILGAAVMVATALVTGSVWALVVGSLAGALAATVLCWVFLPGHVNRFRLERASAHELIHYGKWIFLSTVAGFILLQSDKLILGYFMTMEALGLYNIGFFLASVPLMLGQALIGRLMIPIYRSNPPAESAENFARLRRMRLAFTGGMLALTMPLAMAGFWIVDLLYGARYFGSGAVLVTVSLALIPQMIVLTYDQVALAQGDSRGFFVNTLLRAVVLVGLMLLAVPAFGPLGAALSIALAPVITYPAIVALARRHGAWDGLHDLVCVTAALALAALALWIEWPYLMSAFDI